MKLIYIYNGWNILEMDLLLIEGPTLPQNVKSKSYRHQTSHVSCHGLSRAHAFKGIPLLSLHVHVHVVYSSKYTVKTLRDDSPLTSRTQHAIHCSHLTHHMQGYMTQHASYPLCMSNSSQACNPLCASSSETVLRKISQASRKYQDLRSEDQRRWLFEYRSKRGWTRSSSLCGQN